MKNEFGIFVDHWHQITVIWSQISLVCGLLVLLYYLFVLVRKSSLTEKHDYISSHEIKYLWYAGLAFTISFSLFLNSMIVRVLVTQNSYILALKTMVSLGIGFVFAYALNMYLNVYYPFRLDKRLHRIRFKTRYNPDTGRELKLLNEEEEDIHLTTEMIEHEHISAFEYDVWFDDETGYKLIEKYAGNLRVVICESCNYRTAKETKEEIVEEPSDTTPGKLKKHYKCSFCENAQTKESSIAPLSTN